MELIAITSTIKGLNKLLLNQEAIDDDLNNNWAVVADYSNYSRREGVENPYELLKDLTRKNEKISQKSLSLFINDLKVSLEIKRGINENISLQLYRYLVNL